MDIPALCQAPLAPNTVFTLSAITQTASISHLLACIGTCVHYNNQRELSQDVKRMALNRHKLARYRRQRKQDLLTQLALIIVRCASLSPIIQAEEMYINRADIQTVLARQFSESCHGLVWFGSACA